MVRIMKMSQYKIKQKVVACLYILPNLLILPKLPFYSFEPFFKEEYESHVCFRNPVRNIYRIRLYTKLGYYM